MKHRIAALAVALACALSIPAAGALAADRVDGAGPAVIPPLTVLPVISAQAIEPDPSGNQLVIGTQFGFSFTIQNGNPSTDFTGVSFTANLSGGLTATSGSKSECGGTLTATAPGSISFTGGTVNAGKSCAISSTVVTGAALGAQSATTSVVTASAGLPSLLHSLKGATSLITIVAPPTISAAFNPLQVTVGQTSTLTLTVTNPSANGVQMVGAGGRGTMPAGLPGSGASGATVCGGTVLTSASYVAAIKLMIPAGGSCQVPIVIPTSQAGSFTVTFEGLVTSVYLPSVHTTASLTVVPASVATPPAATSTPPPAASTPVPASAAPAATMARASAPPLASPFASASASESDSPSPGASESVAASTRQTATDSPSQAASTSASATPDVSLLPAPLPAPSDGPGPLAFVVVAVAVVAVGGGAGFLFYRTRRASIKSGPPEAS